MKQILQQSRFYGLRKFAIIEKGKSVPTLSFLFLKIKGKILQYGRGYFAMLFVFTLNFVFSVLGRVVQSPIKLTQG